MTQGQAKRVLYIHQHFRFPEEPGGSRPFEFATRLAGEGHRVTVLMGHATPGRFSRHGIHAVRIATPYDNGMSAARRIVAFLSFMIKTALFAATHRCDVVFASSTPLTTAVPGMVSQLRNRARFVFEVRDVWPKVPVELGELKNPVLIAMAKLLERMAYWRADQVVALSPGMEADILAVSPRTNTVLIPNASDIHLFRGLAVSKEAAVRALGWDEGARNLVFVGSLGRSYDVPWLVRLAALLKPHRIDLRIYGEGSTLTHSRSLAAELGLNSDSVLPGPVAKADVPVIVRASDACVSTLLPNPALEVNSLNKVFDSFAAQRPIFFNHGGWLQEIASQRGAGWRVSHSVEEAAAQVRDVLGESDLEAEGAAAGDLADELFSRDALYARFRATLLNDR